MWVAPPPAWNQTASADIQTAVVRVLNGSTNVRLSWNYVLLDGQSLRYTVFSIRYGVSDPVVVGDVDVNGNPTVYEENDYSTRFTISSSSVFSTLTINTVTEKENATFQCKINAKWAYNIRLEVAGINTIKLIYYTNAFILKLPQ